MRPEVRIQVNKNGTLYVDMDDLIKLFEHDSTANFKEVAEYATMICRELKSQAFARPRLLEPLEKK